MITMYTARTSEVDEIDEAIQEIKKQIDFSALKKHSGGVIFCHLDFIEIGMVERLCEELSFPVIGMTSMASADAGGYGLYDLTLTVLTSDEVRFEAGMTDSVNRGNYVDETDRLYRAIRGKAGSDPAMILTFIPQIRDVAGYEMVAAMDASCHGIPLWGSVPSSIDFSSETVETICDGKALNTGVAMMFIIGPVEPKFIVCSLPSHNISGNRALITKSSGSLLWEVNDLPVLEYLAQMGLVITKENLTTTPMMVYYAGSEDPVALGFFTLFEDGSVLTGGEMPEGTSFAVGSIDEQGIYETAEASIERILDIPGRDVTLLLPCMSRYLMLAPDQGRELRLIRDKLIGTGKPYMMGYAGGEICPMPDTEGKLHNRFHNYTFCACIL